MSESGMLHAEKNGDFGEGSKTQKTMAGVTENKGKRETLDNLADVIAETADWIEMCTDPETAEIVATEDEIEKHFGAPDRAEQKILSLHRMRLKSFQNISHIDDEIESIEAQIARETRHMQERLDELQKFKAQQESSIDWYKYLIGTYLMTSGTKKFNYGVTKGHLTTTAKLIVPDEFIQALPDHFKKVVITPKKAEIKKAIKAGDIKIDDLEGVRLEESTGFTWK